MDSTNVGGEDAQPIAQGALASSSQPQNLEQTEQPKKPEQQQQSQSSTQPASNEAALPRRSHIAPRDRFNNQSLGTSLNTAVKQARVLMVGAGGIGCELLKNLVLTGYGEIHIVDLDTIDLSNLNRQFLFKHEHIKKSKALVAKEVATKFNPRARIVAHHANIKEVQFDVSWFQGFTMVFNALDNLDARRHVNKMCLAADIPLIESGTTGFNGQVQVIKKGVTACYDCTPKDAPKSFPVCTIRSTPSQPIHCIVWGKSYLLNEMFGTSEDQAAFDHSNDAENAQEIEELKKESESLKKIRAAVGTPEFPQLLWDKVFNADIIRLRTVEDMWKTRRAPEPLSYETVMSQAKDAIASQTEVLADGQKVWSLEESLVVFNDSLDRLSKRLLKLREVKDPSGSDPIITFDKDDDDTLDFVASSANIRSTIFGIDRKSRFDVKQMAGNIIPAIATTNAIVAGLCVLQSFKVLKGEYSKAKEIFLSPFAPDRLLAPDRSREPNPDCPVCSVFTTTVKVDPKRTTLEDIVKGFIQTRLGFDEKEFVLNNDIGVLYDPDETENLPKKLADLNINHGSILTVIDDDDDEPWVNVLINIEEASLDDESSAFESAIKEKPDIPKRPKKSPPDQTNGHTEQNGQTNGDSESGAASKGAKRSRPDDDDGQPAKKAKTADQKDDGVVLIEDAGGAIIIGDD